MSWWELLALAVVQGVTEFLPVSSSGHLVLFGDWIGANQDVVDVNIMLHAGTLVAILLVYRRDLLRMLFQDWRLFARVVVGTIPAVIVGLIVKLKFEGLLESVLLTGAMLPVTGLLLFACQSTKPRDQSLAELTYGQALLIGCFQSVAVLPGISRSGSTIAAGLFAGLRREDAALFSFLLAVPVLCGAVLLESLSLIRGKEDLATPLSMMLVGAGVACVVGVFSLKALLIVLQKGALNWFGGWCVAIGGIVLLREFL
jgi:undecaprenyl-diphosphatase